MLCAAIFLSEITPMSAGGQQWAGHVILSVIPVRWHVDDLVYVIHVCKKSKNFKFKNNLDWFIYLCRFL